MQVWGKNKQNKTPNKQTQQKHTHKTKTNNKKKRKTTTSPPKPPQQISSLLAVVFCFVFKREI